MVDSAPTRSRQGLLTAKIIYLYQCVDLESGITIKQGGSTKFAGFGKRLLNELREKGPPDTKIRIHAPPERLYSAYTGGTVLASLSTTFRAMAITRAEYYETGVSIVHRKML